MKAIIIAAGMGSRMHHLTREKPKCMLEFKGKPLLEIQIGILKDAGINDISVITGYKKEMITIPGVTYYTNDDYEHNNILASLLCAEPEIEGDVLISYCDIIYSKEVVDTLLQHHDDLSIVVDTDWKKTYIGRKDHPLSEAESVIFDDEGNVQKIGKIIEGDKESIPGEFIGMLRLSEKGSSVFKNTYHDCYTKYVNKPFQKASVFKKAYLTDIIQELVDRGEVVKCALIKGGWREIDTIEDFEKAQRANLI